ncbi:MAG: hypothetical protein R2771_06865 [Saprospiraceae bacterium]
MIWPNNKEFAFTIVDDTDDATIASTQMIYDYLLKKSIYITKTVWLYDSRDENIGLSLQNEEYKQLILDLNTEGFEIALHNVGSGHFTRDEIKRGIEIFQDIFGYYPQMHINHNLNPDNLYWGYEKYSFVFRKIIELLKIRNKQFFGNDSKSKYFWGDIAKEKIKYFRNRDSSKINTLGFDPQMPYKEKSKLKFSNYWFSCSNGEDLARFNNLLTTENIEILKKEKGCCIVYTHFGDEFLDKNGNLNSDFKSKIDFLSTQNAWFAPVSSILNYLLENRKSEIASEKYLFCLDMKWFFERIFKTKN